jgi:hypothetical protein
MNKPFRSRPRIRRKDESEHTVPEEEIIEGVIEEEYPAEPPLVEPVETPRQARVTTPEISEEPVKRSRLFQVGWIFRLRVADPGLFLVLIALILGGVFFTLMNTTTLAEPIETWWPAVALGIALLWSALALLRRDPTAFLGGAGAAGFCVSLLLETQSIADFQETVVGIMLVTIGLAIVMRGLLLRPGDVIHS